MEKHRPDLTEYEIEVLDRLSSYDFSQWNETEVRENFVVPLLELLGYRKDGDYDVSAEQTYNLNPLFLQIGRKRIELDYLCSVRLNNFWIIEVKPGYDIKGNRSTIKEEDIAQAHFYSLHPEVNAPYFLVTNGWVINLYNRDELSENLDPILSINHNSLKEDFLELDVYIGATQIMPFLKRKILDNIKSVLSSEVYIDRLDEFDTKVKDVISHVRPKVLVNFRKNATEQVKRSQEDFEAFITKVPLRMIPSSLFNYVSTVGQIENLSELMLSKFNDSYPIDRKFFLDEILLEEPKAVTFDYYFNVLKFLIELYKYDPTYNDTFSGKTVKDILIEWIELLIFGFGKKPVLRYLWAFTGLVHRLTIRSLILSPASRNKIDSIVSKDIYELPEEIIAYNGPTPADELINRIDESTILTLSQILKQYYDDGFKEVLCKQEYQRFDSFVQKVESHFDEEYFKLKDELDPKWGTLRSYEYTNHFYDRIFSGTCNILQKEQDILELLPSTIIDRIKLVDSISCDCPTFTDTKIAQFGDECLNALSINPEIVKVPINLVKRYFDPSENPYDFEI